MQFKQFVILAATLTPMAALLATAAPVNARAVGRDATPQFSYGYDPESGSSIERRQSPTFTYGYDPESGADTVERRQFTYGYVPEAGSTVERRQAPTFSYGYNPESGSTVERRQFTYGYDPESGTTVERRQFTYGYGPETDGDNAASAPQAGMASDEFLEMILSDVSSAGTSTDESTPAAAQSAA
ncbi:uncharacterized protein B0H18DRAFT_1135451 [Fomitopsis serialis]|uniref:uncharacterized protein n=1 Tax=Fomitopsis serialis TaxID=139415 RepID=UPI002008085A|nr:uncharacterized protein B0H18DRAFT_1135451 [Neoantrodia serialis]KAH9917537.1 hypothetical protein B0H18DRAFT_1135451 [Neoantrodia serialis]